jgi:hypothetical protein
VNYSGQWMSRKVYILLNHQDEVPCWAKNKTKQNKKALSPGVSACYLYNVFGAYMLKHLHWSLLLLLDKFCPGCQPVKAVCQAHLFHFPIKVKETNISRNCISGHGLTTLPKAINSLLVWLWFLSLTLCFVTSILCSRNRQPRKKHQHLLLPCKRI